MIRSGGGGGGGDCSLLWSKNSGGEDVFDRITLKVK